MTRFGVKGQRVLELKIRCKTDFNDVPEENSWGIGLTLPVFTRLMTEALYQLRENITVKENNKELFHVFTASSFTVDQAPEVLLKNIPEIEDLIINKKFVPFPVRPKDLPNEPFPFQDGCNRIT